MYLRRHNLIRKKIEHRRILLTVFITAIIIFLGFYIYGKLTKNTENIIDSDLMNTISKSESKSIFNIKELNIKELRNRIILLNVYNIKDFSYIFSVDLARQLEQKYGNKIIIIDIIADNFDLNKNTIINYIIKNNIERPVLNIYDFNLGNNTKNLDKYFVLADEEGNIVNTFSYDGNIKNEIIAGIDNILSKKPKLNKNKLSGIVLEKNNQPETFIKSLNHIIYLDKIKDTKDGPYFIISDSKGKKIFFTTISGNIINQIGSGKRGNIDSNGVDSSFCYPSGMAIYDNKILYIADTCNDSIRSVDLRTLDVSTLIKENNLLKNPLSIAILDDNLIISNTSKNPLLKYNLETNKLSPIECSECDKYILKLVKYNDKIYFVNTKNYGLYSIDKEENIQKEIDFNELNENNDIKIEGNNNFHIDDTGFYFIDKFNNKILRIKDNKIINYGINKNENDNIYDLPNDIINFRDKIYITNENNKKLIQLDKNTNKTKVIDISFAPEYNRLRIAEDNFLNINNIDEVIIKDGINNKIDINLDFDYSFEKMAPQTLALYKEDLKNQSAILIKTYSKRDILKNNILILPMLEDNEKYYLKGTFFYCNYNKKTPCLINRYSKKIIVDSASDNNVIKINFLY